MKRKLLSVLLTLCLAFSLLPTAALAATAENCPSGESCIHQAAIGSTHYDTLQEAVNVAAAGQTVTLLKDAELTATLEINKAITLDGANHKITGGSSAKKSLIKVQTDEDFTLTNCIFAPNTPVNISNDEVVAGTRTAVYLKVGGNATVTNNTFEGVDNGYYNAIEFGIGIDPALEGANISGNTFKKSIKNNYFSFYNLQEGAVVNIKDNKLLNSNKNSDGIRISNPKNVNATFNIVNNTFTYNDSGANYDALILLQDYSKEESHQNFGSITLNIEKLSAPQDITTLYYVYKNGTGVITTNQPVVKGDSSIEKFFVAKVDDTYYKTLPEAVAAAQDGKTVTLLKDVTTKVTIPAGKTVTLDLDGKKLTVPTDVGIRVKGKLTVTGNGTVTCDRTPFMVDAGELVIENGTVNSDSDYGIYAKDGGRVTVNGGTLTSLYSPLTGNNTTGNMNFTVNGGTLTAKSGPAIYMPGQVSLTITDGVLNGGISLRMGQVNISGGTINAITTSIGMPTDTVNGKPAYAYSGNVWFPDALYVFGGTYTSNDSHGNSLNLNITGGTFNCANDKGSAVAIYDLGKVEQAMNVEISGAANFATKSTERSAYQVVSFADMKAIPIEGFGKTELVGKVSTTITGGLFSSDPDAYVAAGHYVDASNNGDYPYTVKEGTKPDGALIVVKDATAASVSDSVSEADKSAVETAVSSGKTSVDGVAEAVSASKAALVSSANITPAATDKVEVEVKVNVTVTAANLSAGTLTFEAKPTATITVTRSDNTTEKKENVSVPNSLLSGEITVKLPLPADFKLKQIIHKSAGYADEYILQEGNAQGLKSFKIVEEDGVKIAVFTVSHFSDFELSGKVTYVEPSYSSGSSSYDPTYSVSTPSKTEHGTVTVSPKSASKGDRVTVTVKPDSGYVLETLTVTDKNGNELTLKDKGNGKYTFTMPAGKVEVKATFMEDNSMLNFFYDVPNNAYFYEAVKWAVENGITTGVGNDLFAPEQPCTRAQIVTFLWRAAGSPEPKGAASGMTDVVSGSYYEKAVAWAIENGITTGTTTSTFSPDATCTRAQAVTFLARALKAKAASAAEFSDVPTGSYFADAVAWAAANGVTEGIGGGLFGSDNDCTRGQIVTFLYRAYNK